eukprot:CAMPEP_0176188104 /NCGR_PEP_ID=MMETSP0121_2-20121125/2742_1 /TAXON_ID=160619 /ORGANISM="Kryptoperidinium foliaceum, Strain CCMP 1326" /LENGTH=194 /DNA_ID=CAMNT_0017526667 /DNA_START=16 /DNA_END=601 /DNA_ORIENTATION=+
MAARLRLPQGEADVSCLLEEGRSPRPVSARKPVERADSLTSLDSPGSLGTTGTPGSVRSPQPGSGSLQVALPAWNAESFQVGEVGRIVSLVTMRAREGFEKSEVIMELPPGSRVRVAARGRGRRVCVRDIVSGREGWISVRTAAGETLLSKDVDEPSHPVFAQLSHRRIAHMRCSDQPELCAASLSASPRIVAH